MHIKLKIARCVLPVFLVLLCCSSSKVDDVKGEVKEILDKMGGYYSKTNNFSLEVTYQAKKEKLSGDLLEVTKGTYHQYREGEYFFELNNVITIVREDVTLILDKNTKRVLLTKNTQNEKSPINLNIEESLDFCSSIKHENNRIEFIYSDGNISPYHKLSLHYHPKKYSLEQIIIYPKQYYSMKKNDRDYIDVKTVLEVDYTQYNEQNVKKEKLSFSPYLKKNKGNYSLHEDYSSYELINQIK